MNPDRLSSHVFEANIEVISAHNPRRKAQVKIKFVKVRNLVPVPVRPFSHTPSRKNSLLKQPSIILIRTYYIVLLVVANSPPTASAKASKKENELLLPSGPGFTANTMP